MKYSTHIDSNVYATSNLKIMLLKLGVRSAEQDIGWFIVGTDFASNWRERNRHQQLCNSFLRQAWSY